MKELIIETKQSIWPNVTQPNQILHVGEPMRGQVEAKLKLAQEQQAQWQRNLAAAQEQVIRWDAIRLFCEELLSAAEVPVDTPVVVEKE